MPTPSINTSQTHYADAYSFTVYPDEVIASGPVPRLHRAASRYRPEGVSSPFVLPGHRMPTGWVHDSSSLRLPLYSVAEPPYWWGHRYSTNNYGFSYGIPTIGSFTGGLEERAINGALEKLKDQHVNLSVAFAERKKTAQLFSDAATSISDDVESFRRKNGSLWEKIKKINPRLESFPRAWLALQYGFKPLLEDVTGSLIELNKRDQLPKAYYTTVKKTIFVGDTYQRQDLMYYLGNPAWPLVVEGTTTELCHVSFTYSLKCPVMQSLSALGITNPFSIAWELLPYSFVLDWALPVGNYLSLLDADFGWQYELGSVGRLKKVRLDGTHQVMPSGHTLISGRPEDYVYAADSFSRNVSYSAPWPVFPGLKNPFSATHVANAMSLLTSSFR